MVLIQIHYCTNNLRIGTFWQFMVSLKAVIISGLASQWITSSYLYLGFPKILKTNLSILPWTLLVGLICRIAVATITVFFDTRTAGSGKDVIAQLLFSDSSNPDWKLVIVRFVSPILSYLSGCVGGVFAPSLAAGGSIGAFIANIFSIGNSHLIILLGMIAFLTGVTYAPFTSFVLVLEMTDRHAAIFPMMLAALSASMISKIVDPQSFYGHVKAQYL